MRVALAAAIALVWLAAAPPSGAQVAPSVQIGEADQPVVLRADTLTHNRDSGLVLATGNVEIAQGGRLLMADEVTYNPTTDTVTATGNVVMMEPTGEVMFSDHAEISDGMKYGVIRNIRILLAEDTRIAANGAVRSGGNRTEMRKAVFSPCKLCVEHGNHAPLWQIKAVRVVHDQKNQNIEYTDATLEVFGVPVAYTPFFSHPDPTVERRSGFLTPVYGSNSELGLTLNTPYFFDLAPHRDVTFSPIFTTSEGVILAGEYRERTTSGQFQLAGSITRPEDRDANGDKTSGREIRGHIEGIGQFDITDSARWGFDFERASDDTYLRRYGFNFADTLTSNIYVENFDGRNYAAINGYAFQGLDIDDKSGEEPFVTPIIEYHYVGAPGRRGDSISLDADLMVLTRTDGTDSRRMSVAGGWRMPYYGPIGDVYSISASARGDIYWVDDVDTGGPITEDGFTGRFFPQIAVDWRYPLIRSAGGVRQIIEPIAQLSASPTGGNPDEIPNEDSQAFEFDENNLFSLNRFTGLDRVEGGTRFTYGVRMGAYGAEGGRVTTFFGQSYRIHDDITFAADSGLNESWSDFVGRVNIAPAPWFSLSYRFRVDRTDFSPRRNEIDLALGPDWLRFEFGYVSVDEDPFDINDLGKREEFTTSARWEINDNWALSGSYRRDLEADDTIDGGFGVGFENECLQFSTEVERRFTRDRDIRPETSLKFVLKLKYLG